jgi:hypothetical protein
VEGQKVEAMKTKTEDQLLSRINLVLYIAQIMARKLTQSTGSFMVENMIEEITIHNSGYAEPGYAQPLHNVVAVGNWNGVSVWDSKANDRVTISNLPERISKIFEKMGIPCEWSDEWVECYDCGKLIRTEPDSMWWTPSYTLDDNGAHCKECWGEDVANDVTEAVEA